MVFSAARSAGAAATPATTASDHLGGEAPHLIVRQWVTSLQRLWQADALGCIRRSTARVIIIYAILAAALRRRLQPRSCVNGLATRLSSGVTILWRLGSKRVSPLGVAPSSPPATWELHSPRRARCARRRRAAAGAPSSSSPPAADTTTSVRSSDTASPPPPTPARAFPPWAWRRGARSDHCLLGSKCLLASVGASAIDGIDGILDRGRGQQYLRGERQRRRRRHQPTCPGWGGWGTCRCTCHDIAFIAAAATAATAATASRRAARAE
jgi:hypothetical protein